MRNMKADPSVMRVFSAAGAHAFLAILASAASDNIWSAKNVSLLLVEIIAFLAIQSSDPGSIPVNLRRDGKANDLATPPQGDETPKGNPLVPLHWSRRAWKPGAGIHVRL
jgi:hypothetical protein